MNVTALQSNPETDYRAAMQQAAVAFLLRHRGEHLTGDDQVLDNCTRYLSQSLEVPDWRPLWRCAVDRSGGAVSASAMHDNGRWSVADPRLPAADERLTCVIEALDGTWHRPFTTLELAVLQSLVDPEEQIELDGLSDQAWRERIGNAVPPGAAEAIAHVMGTTLLLAAQGETYMPSSIPIWVQPVAVGLSVARLEMAS